MPETNITAVRVQDNELFRNTRISWGMAGVDNFTQPPAQDADAFTVFLNLLPSATGVLLRRYGYRVFLPILDSGSGDGT